MAGMIRARDIDRGSIFCGARTGTAGEAASAMTATLRAGSEFPE